MDNYEDKFKELENEFNAIPDNGGAHSGVPADEPAPAPAANDSFTAEGAGQTEYPGETPAFSEQNSTAGNGSAFYAPNYAGPVLSKVSYTEQKPANRSKLGRGVKVFCGLLAAVVLFTAACAGGYYLGKNSKKARSYYNSDIKVDLAAKPKDTDGMTAAEVYAQLNPSIVGIRVYNSKSAFDASGVIYTEDGYIITNDHIYENVGAPKFRIYAYDGTEYDAVFVAGDTVSDLAVLKIVNGSGFKAAVFGNSAELVCGENVFAIGRPSDASDNTSITAGTVSLTSRRVKSKSNYSSGLIQTDTAINPGSSGGALVNMYGQVVGITSSKLTGADYDTISFSIPSVTVKRNVDQLIAGGKVTDRAKIGITYLEVNSVYKEMNNYAATGLLVQEVNSDSDLYGKVEKNDIITHINDIEIVKDDIVLDIIESCKAGDEITLTVLSKSGDQKTFTVKLGANIGQSSYKENESDTASQSGSSSGSGGSSGSDGTFNFPQGD
ncbi:MAG: trypsin-like peptidase domain-containing protein [Clostridia bacterium]|nr:trypsin-like peptidase domain-containing protein [Clostridia bacterium]